MAERGLKKGGAGRPGMGRGLAAILSETSSPDPSGELRELPVGQIKPNPGQPRRRFEPESLAALTASIKASGVIQPLLVRPLTGGGYELIAGERRLRAATAAGLDRVPAIVRDPGEEERLQQALIENMVREDLNPVEEARASEALVRELGLSKQELAGRIGRSRSALSNLIRLLELPDEVLKLLEDGELSEGHGRAVLAVEGQSERRRLARTAAAEGWSVRQTEQQARKLAEPPADRRPRATRDAISAEERQAMTEAAELLERSLGHEVKVSARGKEIAAELRFDELAELIELAERLAPGRRR